MKSPVPFFLLLSIVAIACSKDRPEKPRTNKELIVGEWQSQTMSTVISVNNAQQRKDTTETDVLLTFTDDFYVYSDFTFDTLTSKYLFTEDTARYNFKGDTLYFIENALARDTLIVQSIDETDLSLIIEFYQASISGSLVTRQTIINFTRLLPPEEE